jgi:glycosyltransferase involved in cell wall biosynthesis
MSIHVALLFEYPSLNGGERSMLSVLGRLRHDTDWRFSAVCPDSGPLATALRALGISVVDFSLRDRSGGRRDRDELLRQLQNITQRLRPDILHANSLSMSRLTGALRAATSVQNLKTTGHLRDIIRVSGAAMRDLKANHRLVAVSHATRDSHIEGGLQENRVVTIYNGVELPVRNVVDREAFRRQICPSSASTATIALSVGQICLRKAQKDAAVAVVNLIQKGLDIHLVIAGTRFSQKEESREYEQSILDVFNNSGHSERLHRLGDRNDVPQLMQVADLLVHAARQEPFGRVLLEAASCELPIVCSDVGGTPEMLRPDSDAIMFGAGEIESLQAAIHSTVTDDAGRASRAQSARRRIEGRFSAKSATEHLADFWHTVCLM